MYRNGFTLIELLIVVAIIGILAAIAVPNFMNAQIKAKVARAESDMRSLQTALDMYNLDYNNYPMARSNPITGKTGQIRLSERFYPLTTPINYIGSIPIDPFFSETRESDPDFFDTYDYFDNWSITEFHGGEAGNGTRGYSFRIASAGPDGNMTWGSPTTQKNGTWGVDYNATNGVISGGDIVKVGGTVVNSRWVVEYPLDQYPRY